MEVPERPAAQREQDATPGALTARGEWACTIVPNPPAAVLLVTRLSASPARDVQVLLDGKPARKHQAVFVDAIVPDAMPCGSELEYHVVQPSGRPQFDMLEVRWADESGQRRTFRCDDLVHEL